ncbi:MAG: phytoene desaturase family protein [Flavobacteriales bacterium]
MSQKSVAVIGGGFAGLSAATDLAAKGYKVTVFEKNKTTGGRGRMMKQEGFTYDMGPSWYWMPDVFEAYFRRFGKEVSNYYELKRLDPSYRVFLEDGSAFDVPANLEEFRSMLEKLEPGCGESFDVFLNEAKTKYEVSMSDFVWKPSLSWTEFLSPKLLKGAMQLQLFSSLSAHVRKHFSDPRIIQLLEFPVLFLGAKPDKTPAMYSLMNYADIALGTWYPVGGMSKIAEAMTQLAIETGVIIETAANAEEIQVEGKRAKSIRVNGVVKSYDAIVAAADYHHVEQKLLKPEFRTYNSNYWEQRTMSPSSLLFYLGIKGKVNGLLHHNLFFDRSFDEHAVAIYDNPQWPKDPLFYTCVTSKSDDTVAPDGCENVFILIPVAPGLKSDDGARDGYLRECLQRIHKYTGEDLTDRIIYKKSYAHEEFIQDYNAFKGNAYGLANTLKQTAVLKPRMRSAKVENLFFAGQLTVPGPGVPPSLISGCIASEQLHKYFNKN